MEERLLEEILEELELDKSIEISEIPDIHLYMDQVITFFEDKLGHTKRNKEDKLLTKTMINNYAKDKVIMPAVKKKYTKDHVILMILLYQLKQILPISDIKQIFTSIIESNTKDEKTVGDNLTQLYEAYLKHKKESVEDFKKRIKEKQNQLQGKFLLEGIEETEQLETVLFILELMEEATYYKRLAEKLIDIELKK